jgi:DNA adenine methylase
LARRRTTKAKVPPRGDARNADVAGITPRPFLRWAGGKYHRARLLMRFAPQDVHQRVYHEPFLGAASLFFALIHRDARLSDLNGHLIDCYRAIRDSPLSVWKALREHQAADSEVHYYAVRSLYNRSRKGVARAARFLYLNRTCFNGVFRVNTRGDYNVPYGHKASPRFPAVSELLQASAALKRAVLEVQDYETALRAAQKGHFIYLDPPYPPLNGTSYFTHYTADRFGEEDQEKVAAAAMSLHKRGCLFLLSNANTPTIRRLYRGFNVHHLSVTRWVSSSRKKHRVDEVIITNYPVSEALQGAG